MLIVDLHGSGMSLWVMRLCGDTLVLSRCNEETGV